jgi:hypothetical protein
MVDLQAKLLVHIGYYFKGCIRTQGILSVLVIQALGQFVTEEGHGVDM